MPERESTALLRRKLALDVTDPCHVILAAESK